LFGDVIGRIGVQMAMQIDRQRPRFAFDFDGLAAGGFGGGSAMRPA
jgi:hypothetical protein